MLYFVQGDKYLLYNKHLWPYLAKNWCENPFQSYHNRIEFYWISKEVSQVRVKLRECGALESFVNRVLFTACALLSMKAWNSITWRSGEPAADRNITSSNTGEKEMWMEMIPSDYLSRETSRRSYQLFLPSIEFHRVVQAWKARLKGWVEKSEFKFISRIVNQCQRRNFHSQPSWNESKHIQTDKADKNASLRCMFNQFENSKSFYCFLTRRTRYPRRTTLLAFRKGKKKTKTVTARDLCEK